MSIDAAHALVALTEEWLRSWTVAACRSDDLDRARGFILRFDLKLQYPDAIHIAIAQRLGCTLVGLDTAQVASSRAVGLKALNPIEPS